MNLKPVFGYMRVSSKGQVDGDGFARQEEAINQYCRAHGCKVIRWFSEQGVSGTTESMERPAYAEMLSLAGPATATTVIAERADRLARDLMVSELLIQEAQRRNIEVIEAASGTVLSNCDDPTRVMIRQMLGVLAQWEKTMLVRKLREARNRVKRETGRCEGVPSWVKQGKFPELESEIRRMMGRKLSLEQIRLGLNRQKFPTPTGKQYWTKGSVDQAVKMIKKADVPKYASAGNTVNPEAEI